MKLSIDDVEFIGKIPKLPSSLPVFQTKEILYEERKDAVENLTKELRFSKLYNVEIENSIYILSQEGAIQFYRPSGAIWARNLTFDKEFVDEKRLWSSLSKIPDKLDKNNYDLILSPKIEETIKDHAENFFEKSNLLGKYAFYSNTVLDQVLQLDEKGNEINRFGGEATVRFLYKMNDIIVQGGGAKTYAYFYPLKQGNTLIGIYHSWREPINSRTVKLFSFEEAIERALSNDGELKMYYEKKYIIQINQVNLIYYALPPFFYQRFIFPTIKVSGKVISKSKLNEKTGFEFDRYYHVVSPKEYINAEIYAQYLVTKL